MSIVANKFPGVRAVLASSENLAVMSRRHNNSNVICLGARETAFADALRFVQKWLETDFEGGRHQERIDTIGALERELLKV
jgi:ribose 5-phosphate isomerase B